MLAGQGVQIIDWVVMHHTGSGQVWHYLHRGSRPWDHHCRTGLQAGKQFPVAIQAQQPQGTNLELLAIFSCMSCQYTGYKDVGRMTMLQILGPNRNAGTIFLEPMCGGKQLVCTIEDLKRGGYREFGSKMHWRLYWICLAFSLTINTCSFSH